MPTTKVSSKGQIVIPREIRERLNISKGTELELIVIDGGIFLIRVPDDPLKSLRGMLRSKRKRSVQEMRAWVKEEDRKLSERRRADA